jgi:hypothetical protein
VRCQVWLPALQGSAEGQCQLVLDAVGRVVRTEAANDDIGFALRFRKSALSEGDDPRCVRNTHNYR